MKRVLVTGSLGYVGSVLVPYLLSQGHSVRGIDVGFFKDALLYPAPPYETIIKDARDITKEDLRGYEAVIHLAAISNDPFGTLTESQVYGPTRDYAQKIAAVCKELGIDFIFASSCSVYGAGSTELFDERASVVPLTPYSRNKLQIEEDLRALADDSFSPLSLRFATAYGLSPRMRFDIVINMLCGMAVARREIVLNSDGRAWRPFIHVEDMARVFDVALSRATGNGLTILNVGLDSDNLQIIDVARMVEQTVPGATLRFLTTADKEGGAAELVRDRKVQDGVDKRTYRISFARLKEVLPAFTPAHTVAATIPQMTRALAEMGFSENDFKKSGFYRLQQMESLFSQGVIDSEFRFKKPQPHVYP